MKKLAIVMFVLSIIGVTLLNVPATPIRIAHIVNRDDGAETYDKFNTVFDFLYYAQVDIETNANLLVTVQTTLATNALIHVKTSMLGATNGIATLDENGKLSVDAIPVINVIFSGAHAVE